MTSLSGTFLLLNVDTLAHIRVQVEPPLCVDRNALPGVLDRLVIQFSIDDFFILCRFCQDLRVRVCNQAVAICMVGSTHVPCGTAQRDVDLVIHCPGPSLQCPVQWPSSQVKCSWVYQEEGALTSGDHGRLGEANVIADGKTNLPVFWQVDNGQLLTRRQNLALLKPNFPWNIDIEQMRLPVSAD